MNESEFEADGHLSTVTWERLACDELSRAEEKAALDHIAGCDDCGATWRAVRHVRASAEEPATASGQHE